MKKIFKKVFLLTIISSIIMMLVGCGNSNSIVGTWNYLDGDNVRSEVTYQFNKNSTGSYTYYGNTRSFKYEDRGNKVVITYDDNASSSELDYSVKDNVLTIKDNFGSDVNYKRK